MPQMAPPLLLLLLPLVAATAPSAHPAYPSQPASCAADPVLAPERRETHGGGRILDITHYYREDMPSWESGAGVGQFLWLPASMRNGSLANNSEMRMLTHTGTHVDAPGHVFQHYFDAGFDVDTLDLDVLNGPALLVDVPRDENITAKTMESLHIPKGVQRVLFRTLNTDRNLMWKKEFDTSYVGFMKDGAQWLVDNTDIKLVGIDYLSVAAFDDFTFSFSQKPGCHSCGGPQTGECQIWDILVALPATSVAWSGRFADQMHPYKVKDICIPL